MLCSEVSTTLCYVVKFVKTLCSFVIVKNSVIHMFKYKND